MQAADHVSLGLLLCRLADAERFAGNAEEASEAFRRAEAIANEEKVSPHSELRKALTALNGVLAVRSNP